MVSAVVDWALHPKLFLSMRLHCLVLFHLGTHHLQELFDSNTTYKPVVNQVDLHPFMQRRDLVSFCEAHNIALEVRSRYMSAPCPPLPALRCTVIIAADAMIADRDMASCITVLGPAGTRRALRPSHSAENRQSTQEYARSSPHVSLAVEGGGRYSVTTH